MPLSPTTDRPLRVAIVGSGPAGFFAADTLLKSAVPTQVDLFERLPVPYGLVRYGVSPDHLRIRQVTAVFERTAALPGFAYYGNVRIGRDLSMDDLRRFHDVVIFAHGLPHDRPLGVQGEDNTGCESAAGFANWYNGHPEWIERKYTLDSQTAVVVGVGNVGVDVARILSRSAEELADTDIPASVLEKLRNGRIRTVYMLGRRGPAQAAFSTKELRELSDLPNCDLVIDPADLELSAESLAELELPSHAMQKRNVELMREIAARPLRGLSRRLIMRFHVSPVRVVGLGRVQRMVVEKNRLEGEAGHQRAVGTGVTESIDCGLILRSIGNRGEPMADLPFDTRRNVLANEQGRLMAPTGRISGFYATGWVGRGPEGVIGATKQDSAAVVALTLGDLPNLTPCAEPDREALDQHLARARVRVVNWDDWKRLDALEIERGKVAGKAREKFVTVESMLAALNAPAARGGVLRV